MVAVRMADAPTPPARTADQPPLISVAIPTCNRPDDLTRCLASLARVRYPRWELVLIDQSDGVDTHQLAIAWGALIPKIIYRRLTQKNLSAARNVAMETAQGDFLAFIDDDCTVAPDWLDGVRDVFAEEPQAQLAFGAVEAAEHDHLAYFVTTARIDRRERLRGARGAVRLCGIGASMCLRLSPSLPRSFDVQLGAGTRFRGGEERDYAFRLLAAGATIAQSPRIHVTHHGARPYAGGVAAQQLRGYFYGSGACDGKLVRCGAWRILVPVIAASLIARVAEVRPLNILRRRPTDFGRLLMYVRGLRDGFNSSVDPAGASLR